jgi:hypothetical protein
MVEQQSRKKAVVLTITLLLAGVVLIVVFIRPGQSDVQKQQPTRATKRDEPNNGSVIRSNGGRAENGAKIPHEDPILDTSGIDEMQAEYVEMIQKRWEAVAEVPVHPWRKNLLGNIRSETMEQTLRNFANFDDCSLAETSISGYDSSEACAEFQKRVLVGLMRVRKVLAYGREHPEEVVPTLRHQLGDSLLAWPATYEKRQQDWADGIRTHEKPDAYLRSQKTCLAAAYISSGSRPNIPAANVCTVSCWR